MPELPFVSGWHSIHPLFTHIPLVLLFLAPVFAFVAIVVREKTRRTLIISGCSPMRLGLGSPIAAFESGKAAALSVNGPGTKNIIETRLEFASLARSSFIIAALLFVLSLLLCRLLRVEPKELSLVLPVSAVAFYALGFLWLVHAAYNGERLVHEFGAGRMASP